jgi:hypothetical protein
MNSSRVPFRRRLWVHIACGSLVVAFAGAGALAASTPAWAQSPTPNARMWDTAPGGANPGVSAVVVEGLGMGNCPSSVAQIEAATIAFLNAGDRTVTEISPQSYCMGTEGISGYEDRLRSINGDVMANAGNASSDWAGFMLDEEPGFDFTASQLETLNSYAKTLMDNDAGLPFVFTENQPNGWDLGTYKDIVSGTWLAPQIYSTSMADSTNSLCSTYSLCTNDVTINDTDAAPWDEISYVTGLINGAPWSTPLWPGANYCNIWVPVG